MDLIPEPIFHLRRATVRLGSAPALREVDFSLEAGEFVAVLGDNGAGKTTLIKALLGMAPLSDGSLEIFGRPISAFSDWRRIGYVPQRFTAVTGVPATSREVVLSGRAGRSWLRPGYTAADKRAAELAMVQVGLGNMAQTPVHELSGGQQQRVLIARALSAAPDVLILDEPASSIDDESQHALVEILATFKHQGKSVILVAHGLGPMAELVGRAVVLEGGRVAYDGDPLKAGLDGAHLHVHHHPQPHEVVLKKQLRRRGSFGGGEEQAGG